MKTGIAIVLLSLCVGGCTNSMAYQPGTEPRTYAVHKNGQYALRTSGSHDAVWDVFVIQDDRIGFARTSGGALEAVADGERMRLPDGSYEWQYVPPLPALPA